MKIRIMIPIDTAGTRNNWRPFITISSIIMILTISIILPKVNGSSILKLSSESELISTKFLFRRSEYLCGNGILDPGEECDPRISSNSECCTDKCKKRPDSFTSCSNGRGVCNNGVCTTRQSQCSSLDQQVLSLAQNVALQGPFSSCNLASQSSDAPNVRPLSSLSMDCQISCVGRNIAGNKSSICTDMSQFVSSMPDGSFCSAASGSESKPGVCIKGTCQIEGDKCERLRCNNNGICILNPNGVPQCRCNNGYSGPDCTIADKCPQGQRIDSCGICDGDNSSCNPSSISEFFTSANFLTLWLPVSIGALLVLLSISLITVYMVRRQDRPSKKESNPIRSFNVLSAQVPAAKETTKQANAIGISVKFDEFNVIHDYEAQMPDELDLKVGDVLLKLFEYDDGWAKGYNTRTEKEGVYPVGFTERIVNSVVIATPSIHSSDNGSRPGSSAML